jgi:hypothetical protein
MKTETKWIIGGVVVAGFAYYMWSKKAAAAPAAPTAQVPAGQPVPAGQLPPTGIPVTVSPGAPTPAVPTLPAGFQLPTGFQLPGAGSTPAITTPVSLTTSFQAADLNTGFYRNFNPGDQVIIYGQPTGGYTTFSDVSAQPNLYVTQAVVAGWY